MRKNTALLKPLNLSWGFSASADRASGAGGSWLCGAWPGHYRRLNSILDLDSLDANSNSPPCCDNPKCFQTLPNVPWGQYHPRLRATSLIRCPVCHGLSSPWWRLTIFQQPFLLDQWPPDLILYCPGSYHLLTLWISSRLLSVPAYVHSSWFLGFKP